MHPEYASFDVMSVEGSICMRFINKISRKNR